MSYSGPHGIRILPQPVSHQLQCHARAIRIGRRAWISHHLGPRAPLPRGSLPVPHPGPGRRFESDPYNPSGHQHAATPAPPSDASGRRYGHAQPDDGRPGDPRGVGRLCRKRVSGIGRLLEIASSPNGARDSSDSRALERTTFSLEEHVLFPLPQTPPPIYVGGLVSPAVRRAARLGDGFLLSAGTTLGQTQERIELYRESLEKEPKLPIAINRIVQVVSSQAEKERVLSLIAPAYLNLYDNWGHQDVQRLSDQERLFHQTAEAHFILGEPAECIDKIQEYRAHGVGHIACLMNFGNPPLEIVDRSMRLFAEKVMPHF